MGEVAHWPTGALGDGRGGVRGSDGASQGNAILGTSTSPTAVRCLQVSRSPQHRRAMPFLPFRRECGFRGRSVDVHPQCRIDVDAAASIGRLRLPSRSLFGIQSAGGGLQFRKQSSTFWGDQSQEHADVCGHREVPGPGLTVSGRHTGGAELGSPSMGTESPIVHRVYNSAGITLGGTIMIEKANSSSPLSHSSKVSSPLAPSSPQIQVSEDSRNSLQDKTIDDILEEKEWEVRNVGDWLDGEGEEFFRDYNDLPLPPTKGPQLRERELVQHPPLRKPPTSPKFQKGGQYNREKKKEANGVMSN